MNAFENAEIEITAQRAAELLAGGATVVDVRETYEREAGYIEGTRHIELERLASSAEQIDRTQPVVFLAGSGCARRWRPAHSARPGMTRTR